MDLLERAENHQTAEEAHDILDKVLDALVNDDISDKEAHQISSAVRKRRRTLLKILEEKEGIDKYYDPG